MRWKRSHSAGACDFPRDPQSLPDGESLFWLPGLQPKAVFFKAVDIGEPAECAGVLPFDLANLSGLDQRRAPDSWHAVWRDAEIAHQFWLLDAPPAHAAQYTVTLPFDAFFELRVNAARDFWRALQGRRSRRALQVMPNQLPRYYILILRALDARQAGVSYRKIGEGLLNFNGTKTDWESDPRKNESRRLVAAGKHMMLGGYRTLLHYPIKLRRR